MFETAFANVIICFGSDDEFPRRPRFPKNCMICGRKVGRFGMFEKSGIYDGMYSCADPRVTVKDRDAVRRVLKSCCRLVHMPLMLKMFVENIELSNVLSRFLKFGSNQKRCSFRRFMLSGHGTPELPVAVTDAILNYLISL